MGREWQWSRSLAGAEDQESSTTPGCMSGMLHYFDFHHLLLFAGSSAASSRTSSGGAARCPPEQSPSLSFPAGHYAPQQLKGLEAPRNSLELDERKAASASTIDEELCDIPVGIEVFPASASSAKNKNKKNMMTLLEEERTTTCSQAETPRASNIVARLMGLEVLPDGASTSPAGINTKTPPSPTLMAPQQQLQKMSSKKMINFAGDQTRKPPAPRQPLQSLNCNISGSRSLPESPRVSSSRTSWDADPRLSLQINKENTTNYKMVHEFNNSGDLPINHSSLPPSPSTTAKLGKKESLLKHQDENRSPRNQSIAREIAKPTARDRRGRVGDHVGDISEETGTKSKRTSAPEKKVLCESYVQNQAKPSSSSPPRLKFFELQKIEGSEEIDRVLNPKTQPPKPLPTTSSQFKRAANDHNSEAKKAKMVQNKCTKASNERFTERIKKPNSQSLSTSASLFQSPSSSSALQDQKQASNKLKWSSSPSTATSNGRKDASPPPRSQQTLENSSLKSPSIQKIGQLHKPIFERDLPEYRYVKSILEHTDPLFRWYSTSLPVDPIIFHQIELEIELDENKDQNELLRGSMQFKWNRKLIFHLVEELIGDLLLRWSNLATGSGTGAAAANLVNRERKKLFFLSQETAGYCKSTGSGEPWLLQRLWERIRSFPAADCRVVGDIDTLVAGDLAEANTRRLLLHPAVVEEAEDVVATVEHEILDDLLDDATVSLAVSMTTTRGSSRGGSRGSTTEPDVTI